MKIEGGCLCGAIRYDLDGPPIATAVCHCRNCQKQSGSAFSINLVIRTEQIKITGALTEYQDQSAAGQPVGRRFCSSCGSPVLSVLGSSPGIAAIKAGTLDDTSLAVPSVQIWCDSRLPWLEPLPGMPVFNRDIPKTTQAD